MPAARYQLIKDVYMPLDGQWGIVLAGTVFDDDTKVTYAGTHAIRLNEVAGPLAPHGKATAVRGVARQ